jgi:hypothetical protein
MEISGAEAAEAIGCYPAMTIIEHRLTHCTNFVTGEAGAYSTYTVDYKGSLSADLVQQLANKWNLTIVWRKQTYEGI